ncbi:MAG: hypothetical protein ABSE69_13580 [Roseiarcus sp.]
MTSQELSTLPVRQLGRTGVTVTELGLGTAPLGELWDVIGEGEAGALLNAAWEGGVRYFDTRPGTARDRLNIGSVARCIASRAINS